VTPEGQVWLMTYDMKYDDEPTHTNVLFQLKRLMELVGPEDTLIFFFSGHSMSKDGKHYLLSVNADPRTSETLESSSISVDGLRQLFSQCRARQVVLCLDGCRNVPDAGKGDTDNLLTEDFVKGFTGQPRKPEQIRQNFAVLFACSVGERAYE
jgi:uncharacterized caspase-like protein